jgi:hypothetical protein
MKDTLTSRGIRGTRRSTTFTLFSKQMTEKRAYGLLALAALCACFGSGYQVRAFLFFFLLLACEISGD